jgi:hypothetical protein
VISKNYLAVNSPQELEIRDCSGLSNPVFIVSASAVSDQKYIIRFFESSAANFDLETQIFALASQKQYCPALIETDSKTYRVEQFYGSGPLKNHELKREDVM